MPCLNEKPLRKNCKAHFGWQCSDDFGRGGRRLTGVSQGRQGQKGRTGPPKCDTCSTPVGLAYEACRAVIDHAFHQLGAEKIFAETVDKERSPGLIEKLGMVYDGRDGDMLFYKLLPPCRKICL